MRIHLVVGSLIALSLGCEACVDNCVSILQKHVSCLRSVCDDSCIKNLIDPVIFLHDNNVVSYKHELTHLSLKKISTEGNLFPLFESWDIFLKSYRKVESDLFMYEFSIQLFFLYKNILSHYSDISEHKVTVGEVMQLSSQIMSLPIDQVLAALERCYHQFMIIMGHYGVHQGMSLASWIRQYWWVPPVVVISFAYSIVRHFLLPKASEVIGGLPGFHQKEDLA